MNIARTTMNLPTLKDVEGQAKANYVRVVRVSIPKRYTPMQKCAECRGQEQKQHIHAEELQPMYQKSGYRFLTPQAMEKYKKALVYVMKQRWFNENLDPMDCGGGMDTLFKDGKEYFEAVSLCREKGFFKKLRNPASALINSEKARSILMQSIQDEWQITPVA